MTEHNDNREDETTQSEEMPFLDHMEELRQRLIRIFASVIIFSLIAYIFSDYLVDFIVEPVGTAYFRDPAGAFMLKIKVSAFAGVMLSIPVILYHLWRFVVPGLYATEVKFLIPVTLLGTLFFFGGATFCFLLVIPLAMEFLKGFGTDKVQAWIDIKEYFSFVFWLCIAFGTVFELPIISFFLGKLGIISSQTLSQVRRYAVVAILILSAVITPPDLFSQILLAVPLYLLFEASIIVVRLTGRRN